jgi:hypothetical protein
MRDPSQYAGLSQKLSLVLSQIYVQRIDMTWRKRVEDPFYAVPHELRGKISKQKAIGQNLKFGRFASAFRRRVLGPIDPSKIGVRIRQQKKYVKVGYGKGHDSGGLVEDTVSQGLALWVLDVSKIPTERAKIDIRRQWEKSWRSGLIGPHSPVVIQGEIQSILADPSLVELVLSEVEVWDLTRILGCLSKKSFKVVLQLLGFASFKEGSDPNNMLILVVATRDRNPSRVGKTSRLPSKREILYNLRRGAGRSVKVVEEETTKYHDQIYSAFCIKV